MLGFHRTLLSLSVHLFVQVGVLGGAGLVSGLLTIPAAVALCSALAEPLAKQLGNCCLSAEARTGKLLGTELNDCKNITEMQVGCRVSATARDVALHSRLDPFVGARHNI